MIPGSFYFAIVLFVVIEFGMWYVYFKFVPPPPVGKGRIEGYDVLERQSAIHASHARSIAKKHHAEDQSVSALESVLSGQSVYAKKPYLDQLDLQMPYFFATAIMVIVLILWIPVYNMMYSNGLIKVYNPMVPISSSDGVVTLKIVKEALGYDWKVYPNVAEVGGMISSEQVYQVTCVSGQSVSVFSKDSKEYKVWLLEGKASAVVAGGGQILSINCMSSSWIVVEGQ